MDKNPVDDFLKTAGMDVQPDKPTEPTEGVDALSEYMKSTGDAKAHDKALFAQLFENGRTGNYSTRTKTLVEKTAEVLKK